MGVLRRQRLPVSLLPSLEGPASIGEELAVWTLDALDVWLQPLVRPLGSGMVTSGECSSSTPGSAIPWGQPILGKQPLDLAGPSSVCVEEGGLPSTPIVKAVTQLCGRDLNWGPAQETGGGLSWCTCPLGCSWKLETSPPASTQTGLSPSLFCFPAKERRQCPGVRGAGGFDLTEVTSHSSGPASL